VSPLKTTNRTRPEKAYWRSLDELADNPEFRRFVENEFPAHADEMLEPSRRGFLKIMGASMALAGMTACRWPEEEIVPFASRPAGYTPGEPRQYATAMELGGVALGLLATSYDGRPIKIEGNPTHPASLGATNVFAQASVLELYDPDRSRKVIRREDGEDFSKSWEDFARFAREHLGERGSGDGRGLRILSEASSSPSLQAMRDRLLGAFPQARWHEYEPVSRESEREGTRLVLGRACRAALDLARADIIVSLDEDFLLHHPGAVRYARDFVSGRRPERGECNRLYVAESCYSVTGSMADHRLPIPARSIPALAGSLGASLVLDHGLALPQGCEGLRSSFERCRERTVDAEFVESMARDLVEYRGRSLVTAGPRQPAVVHALACVLNHALGNVGKTVSYLEAQDQDRPDHVTSIRELARQMAAGEVETLVLLGGNPAFDAPADLEFARLLESVPTTVHLGLHRNETAHVCDWHLPRAHYLESWGDVRDWEGRIGLVQPLIEPLFGGKTPIELLALLLDEAPSKGHDIVRRTLVDAGTGADADWRRALHDGLIPDTGLAAAEASPSCRGWIGELDSALESATAVSDNEIELVFVQDAGLHDGRFANNGWLHELPDPLTKLTWDNAAMVGPGTADRLGVKQGDMIRVENGQGSLELPVYVMPGQAAGSVSVSLGYGRRNSGSVGTGVGVDAYALRASESMHDTSVRVEKIPGTYLLATTQNHYAVEPLGADETVKRAADLAREMDIRDFLDHDDSHDDHGPHVADLWKQWEYEGRKWGMAIDLNSCTGCNSCVVACQAENNIPIVGKEEVARGREMLWLRVDRYFSGDPEDPAVAHQPLTCHHCENAPCEQVCPVAATVHDKEGLNVMVYNRCVGTRYCMNNCPYKVRRFNFFNNHKDETSLEKMAYNPEVTVRGRGVMEKCTFCVQRINRAKIQAKNEGRPVRDGEVTTACEQACPTQAITFGDLNDPEGRVRELHHDRRAYGLLEFLGIKPRTRYLTRLRNRAGKGPTHG